MKLLKQKLTGKAALIIVFLLAGCAGPKIKDGNAEKPFFNTIKSAVMVSFAGPADKIKKKAVLAVKGTERLRFEIKGFFNEPVFILVANGRKVQAFFIQDNAYFEGELFDENSDNPAAIFINRAGKLILKSKEPDVSVAFKITDKNTGIPSLAEFTSADYKLSFIFLDPEINKELPDVLFILFAPKSARKISEEQIKRYLEKWNK